MNQCNMLEEGKTLHGKSYDYAINKKLASGLFSGILKVRGNLGQIDSGFSVDISTSERYSSNLIETIELRGEKLYIYTHHNSDVQLNNGQEWISYGQHKYRGQIKDGVPHGKGEMKWQNCSVYKGSWNNGNMNGFGIMTWPSGKRYEGEWHDGAQSGHGTMFYPNGSIYDGDFQRGMREGHGILRQPNGEYYEGNFINDKISNQGVFVDEKGNKFGVDMLHKRAEKTPFSKFWGKTWQLWASITCFGLAILFAIWVFGFFSGDGPSRISARGVIATILMVIGGFKFLIGFFNDLSSNNE